MKEMMQKFALAGAICLGALTGVAATGKSAAFPLDLIEGDRVSAGTEELTFSNLWDGDAEATVTIAQDGAAIFEGLTGEGTKTWTVERNGRYVLTHTTYTNGVAGKVETAVFVVEGKEVPVGELTVAWEAGSFMYDNNGKTPGVTAKNGDQVLEKGVDYTVHYEGNTNAGTAKAILTGLPPYVGSVTNEFAIAKRVVELTSGSASKAYDGTALVCHSVTTNGDGFVAGEGVDFTFTGSQMIAGSSKNTFDYTFKTGTLAGNYTITKTEGDLEVTAGKIVNPFDPDDPTKPVTPEVLAKANCVTNYDGEGHAIDVASLLNPLVADCLTAIEYSLDSANEPFAAENPTFTNVVTTSVWYRVTTKNYEPFTTNAMLAILPRPITKVVVAAIADLTYDGKPKTPVPAVSDLRVLSGETEPTDILTAEDYSISYDDNVNVGTAKIIFTGKGNYDSELTNTFMIAKATLPPDVKPDPVTPDPANPDGPYSAFDYVGVYDGTGHTIDTNGLAVAYRAAVGAGFAVSYAVGESGGMGQPATPWNGVAPVFTNAATNVVWYKVSSANYADIVHPAKVTIVPRPITIASVDGTWTYDTVAHGTNEVEIVEKVEGVETAYEFPEGEGIEVDEASFPTITDVGEKDNVFEWAFAEGTLAGNYAVTVRYGKLKVNARTIGDDDKNWDIRLDKAPMYDGEVQSAPIIQVCYVKPDGNLDYIPYTLAGNTATDAGNYKVKISGKGNYAGTVEKDWAIMPRNLRMTSGTGTWMYDGEAHSNDTVTVTGDGFVAGEGATYAGFPQVTHFADAAEPVENAFAYKLNENTKAKNYVIVTEKGKVKMTRRPVTLTAPTKSKTYDGTPLTFGESEIKIEFAGVVGGAVPSAPQPTQNEAAFDDGCGAAGVRALPEGEAFAFSNFASITEAGQTAATFSIADGTALMDDYDVTVAQGATLTVQKSATEITVTAKSKSWTYDGETHELHEYDATNLGTLVAGDELDVTFDEASVVTTPVDGEVENKIVSVKVLRTTSGQQQDVSANYTLAAYPGTLKVTKRPVTLTSKGASKSYDGTALTRHEVEVGGDGFVGEDGATYAFSGSQLDKGKSKNAFEYSLKSSTNAAYYEITKVEGELEVFPADISAGTELDWEIVLGPALTYNGIAQIQTVTSVKFRGLDLDYTVGGNQQTDAGDYELTLAGQGNFTGEKKVAWLIAKKALTLTAGSGEKPYDGTPLTSNAVTAEGFVAGESATCACTGSQLDVGSSENVVAAIDWTGAKASNYAVTKKPGVLKVEPLAVTVKSKNISKPFDGTPLKLTAGDIELSCGVPGGHALPAGESFVYGDFAERTEAGQASGTFSIAAGANTKLANYAITSVYGTITITRSATEIGVTARSKSWPYDATTHELHEYDATNLDILQPGEELVVTFKEASKVTTPCDGVAQDGRVPNEIESIRVVKTTSGQQQDVTANYTVTAYPGVLAVTKRKVTVSVTGETVSATYDGEEHTASGYDIATEDELYDIAAKTSFGGTDEVTRTDAGKSQMGLKPSDFTNSDEYFDVTYAVTDGWVDIEAADISAGTEQDFAITLGENPKYNGTVQTIPVTAVTYKGLPVTYTLAGENATHAGTYTLTVKANGNFKGERSTTWKILKRQVKLTSGSASRAYNGQPLVNGDVTVSGDGFIGLEGATFEVTGSQTLAGSSKNAFAYALKAGTQEGDYDIEKVEGDLVVTKAKYPGQEEGGSGIQWNVAADAATWMYDGQQHGVTLTGVPSGVTPHLTGNAAKDVGEYTASVTFDFDTANYEPPKAPAPLKWSITARPLSLQTVNAEKPYDGFPLTVDKANITPGLSGYAEGECFDYFDLASITEVGETPATFKYRDSASAKVSNYAVSVVGGATLKVTVGGDQISVTARDGTWAYDATDHRKMEWDIVNGNKLLAGHEFRIKIDETKSVVKTPEDGPEHNGIVSNVFKYVKIVETETGADKTKNYNLFVYEGALQITNRVICSEELRVNSEEFTEKIEKTYDGEATNVTVTAELLQPAMVRYGESVDDISTTTEPEFTDAGEYVVWYTVAAQYYNTYTNKVEVKIDKRPIALTSPTKSKPFDGTALTFDGGEIEISMTSGETPLPQGESLVFSDFASITDAGRVDATFEYAAGADTSLNNYEVTVKKGTLTVNASAEEITVTAKSGSWPYDGEDHVLHDCEVENEEVLQFGDELVVEYLPASKVTTPDDGEVENVITSVKVMRGGEDGEDVTRNYSIVTYPGKIKVENATIRSEELRVKSEECVYDGEGHTIEVEAFGLLTSPATVVYSATGEGAWKLDPMAVAVKNAGTHAIRYRVSAKFYNDYFGEATVKINPRPVTLLSGSATKPYDGTPLRKDEVKVKAGSLDFVDGEGVTPSCTSAQTGVGRIENGFNYEFKSGTLQDNYTIIPAFGWLEVTPGTLTVDPAKSGYNAPYDGKAHGPEVLAALSGLGFNQEACEITYALVPGDESAYSPTMPTLTDIGTQTVYVKIKAQNFEIVYAEMTVVVTEKEITDEMVQPGEDAFFFDGDAKKPTVDVVYEVDGADICTESDYTLEYGAKAGAGWWVTVTGKGNYSGTVMKIVPVLKRPVAPPVVPSMSYNGKTQKPKIPADERWTVVENPGGINVGEYTNVVLRLTNTTDYKWKGGAEDETDITLVFRVTKANNGWSQYPDMKGWAYGETPSEPNLGQARYGTVKVAYRKAGADVTTETATRPELPGEYVARFWVDETENYIGVAVHEPYKDIAFEITGTAPGGDHTTTTPVPVPHKWLDPYLAEFGGDYETAGNAKGRNGVALWESYVAGLDPTDAGSRFTAKIKMGADNKPIVSWNPALNGETAEGEGILKGERVYRIHGKVRLEDASWTPDIDPKDGVYRFYKITVELPK